MDKAEIAARSARARARIRASQLPAIAPQEPDLAQFQRLRFAMADDQPAPKKPLLSRVIPIGWLRAVLRDMVNIRNERKRAKMKAHLRWTKDEFDLWGR